MDYATAKSGELTIRDCTNSDLARIYEIEKLSFDDPYPLSLFQTMLAEYPQGFRVADYDGLLQGYCAVTPANEEGVMLINSIAVHPEYKQHGIANALILDAISRIRELEPKANRVILQVSVDNIAAQKLYAKIGFMYSQGIKNYYGRSKDAFEMELKLAEK